MKPSNMLVLAISSAITICCQGKSLSQTVKSQAAYSPDLYRWTAANFPNPLNDPDRCRSQNGNSVCNPDTDSQVSEAEAGSLSRDIENVLSRNPCACGSNCQEAFPRGRYSFSVAIAHSLDEHIRDFTQQLGMTYWTNLARCADGLVIGLATDSREVYVTTSPLVQRIINNRCLQIVIDKNRGDFSNGEFRKGLGQMIEDFGSVTRGANCEDFRQRGLTIGQIIGIVMGVLSAVAFIVTIITLCIGFCQNWECVVGTCVGVCIGAILGAIQSCINAIIMDCWMSMLDACGCSEICECEPFDCIGEGDEREDGGGGAGGDF